MMISDGDLEALERSVLRRDPGARGKLASALRGLSASERARDGRLPAPHLTHRRRRRRAKRGPSITLEGPEDERRWI